MELNKLTLIAPAFKAIFGGTVTYSESCSQVAAKLPFKEDINEQYAVIKDAPKAYVYSIDGVGTFAVAKTKAAADKYLALALSNADAAEFEKVADTAPSGKVAGLTAIVTGSAQGFGQGIAHGLAKEGANVVIADLNAELAEKNANEFCAQYGEGRAIFSKVDVSDEQSVSQMVEDTVKAYGGIDIFVNNAGIVRAGGLDEMTLQDFNLVTKINYQAYFLCAKYASEIMKIQSSLSNGEKFFDIIQINSKSGLSGSNKNFAYAGSKFGGIGLTQSFALELVPFNIKVNSICPGNFLDGPLWCDPEKGLFKQYLEAGKVPGAKTVADVKKAYEAKVPMNRGCRTEDVMRAIFYCVEQQYETGQAIPVTGGQNMLR